MAITAFSSTGTRPSAISPVRVATVTLALAGAGTLLGGVSGALALAVAMSLRLEMAWLGDPSYLLVAGIVGAFVGGVAAPVTSWIFLRNVPLGRAMLRTTLAAAVAGAVSGMLFLDNILVPVWGALFGFLVEAVRLYLSTPRRPRSSVMAGSSTRR